MHIGMDTSNSYIFQYHLEKFFFHTRVVNSIPANDSSL
ncbi:hypothetical protein BN129_3117 [Cronobacter sakazakii 701]|nr:hypothetical protein BN129_3117 [Cronobacter sakazakii 701]